MRYLVTFMGGGFQITMLLPLNEVKERFKFYKDVGINVTSYSVKKDTKTDSVKSLTK